MSTGSNKINSMINWTKKHLRHRSGDDNTSRANTFTRRFSKRFSKIRKKKSEPDAVDHKSKTSLVRSATVSSPNVSSGSSHANSRKSSSSFRNSPNRSISQSSKEGSPAKELQSTPNISLHRSLTTLEGHRSGNYKSSEPMNQSHLKTNYSDNQSASRHEMSNSNISQSQRVNGVTTPENAPNHSYPLDLNPFGEEDEDNPEPECRPNLKEKRVSYPVDMNPFGSESDCSRRGSGSRTSGLQDSSDNVQALYNKLSEAPTPPPERKTYSPSTGHHHINIRTKEQELSTSPINNNNNNTSTLSTLNVDNTHPQGGYVPSSTSSSVGLSKSTLSDATINQKSTFSTSLQEDKSTVSTNLQNDKSTVSASLHNDKFTVSTSLQNDKSTVSASLHNENSTSSSRLQNENSTMSTIQQNDKTTESSSLHTEKSTVSTSLHEEEKSTTSTSLHEEKSTVSTSLHEEEKSTTSTSQHEEKSTVSTSLHNDKSSSTNTISNSSSLSQQIFINADSKPKVSETKAVNGWGGPPVATVEKTNDGSLDKVLHIKEVDIECEAKCQNKLNNNYVKDQALENIDNINNNNINSNNCKEKMQVNNNNKEISVNSINNASSESRIKDDLHSEQNRLNSHSESNGTKDSTNPFDEDDSDDVNISDKIHKPTKPSTNPFDEDDDDQEVELGENTLPTPRTSTPAATPKQPVKDYTSTLPTPIPRRPRRLHGSTTCLQASPLYSHRSASSTLSLNTTFDCLPLRDNIQDDPFTRRDGGRCSISTGNIGQFRREGVMASLPPGQRILTRKKRRAPLPPSQIMLASTNGHHILQEDPEVSPSLSPFHRSSSTMSLKKMAPPRPPPPKVSLP